MEEDKLRANYSDYEADNIDNQNGALSEGGVCVKKEWNENDDGGKGETGCHQEIGVPAEITTKNDAPNEGWSHADFDMPPDAFVDGGKDRDKFVLMSELIKEVQEYANQCDADNANV